MTSKQVAYRFAELSLRLVSRTLFGGNGPVNTKGLVNRVASLSVSLYLCKGVGAI